MRTNDLIALSTRYALRQRRRLMPVVLGVALGVALLVVVMAGGETIGNAASQQILSQGSLKQITVTAPTSQTGNSAELTPERLTEFARLSHVVNVYPLVQFQVAANLGATQSILSLTNIPGPQELPSLSRGVWPVSAEDQIVVPDHGLLGKSRQGLSGVALLGETVDLKVQTMQGLGRVVTIPVQVVGVYHAPQGPELSLPPSYVPLPFLLSVMAQADQQPESDYIRSLKYVAAVVNVDKPASTQAVADLIEQQGFATNYIEKQVQGLSEKVGAMELVALSLIVVILLISGLSIANLLSSSVRQRRSELGLMLALGYSPQSLGLIVAGESLSMGVLGALVGTTVAGLGMLAFHLMHGEVIITLPWWSIPATVVMTALLCLAASLPPARRVMHMDIVRALREE